MIFNNTNLHSKQNIQTRQLYNRRVRRFNKEHNEPLVYSLSKVQKCCLCISGQLSLNEFILIEITNLSFIYFPLRKLIVCTICVTKNTSFCLIQF